MGTSETPVPTIHELARSAAAARGAQNGWRVNSWRVELMRAGMDQTAACTTSVERRCIHLGSTSRAGPASA